MIFSVSSLFNIYVVITRFRLYLFVLFFDLFYCVFFETTKTYVCFWDKNYVHVWCCCWFISYMFVLLYYKQHTRREHNIAFVLCYRLFMSIFDVIYSLMLPQQWALSRRGYVVHTRTYTPFWKSWTIVFCSFTRQFKKTRPAGSYLFWYLPPLKTAFQK